MTKKYIPEGAYLCQITDVDTKPYEILFDGTKSNRQCPVLSLRLHIVEGEFSGQFVTWINFTAYSGEWDGYYNEASRTKMEELFKQFKVIYVKPQYWDEVAQDFDGAQCYLYVKANSYNENYIKSYCLNPL